MSSVSARHLSPVDAISPSPPDRHQRYLRQSLFPAIGRDGQRQLAATRVLLIGCGALGSEIANLLVRAGVGRLTVADRDYVELHNLQRQALFDEDDVAQHLPKAIAATQKLARINSDVVVEPVVADINSENLEALATNADFIVDGTDNFETRYLVNDVAIKLGLPWVYGGVIASYGMTMTVRPGVTPCLRCIFPTPPEPGSAPTCDTAGVIGPAVALVAALQAAEALKLAVGDVEALNRDLLALDIWRLSFDRIPLAAPDPDCPACGKRELVFLDRPPRTQMAVLCGHDAVQVRIHPAPHLDLPALAQRLGPLGAVLSNAFLIRFREDDGGHELTIFPDGRAIIKGVTDESEAQTLYARYVGL